jgi:stage V sporulation protein R
MTQKVLQPEDVVDYAEHHSGTVANHPGRINPYRLGLALLNDIERRWDKGQFGKEWEDCEDLRKKRSWNTGVMMGKEKVFEVWQHFNDVSFIDEFLTPDFIAEHMFFGYEWNDDIEAYTIATRDFKKIKEKLLFGLTNHGRPFIYVVDGNYENRGELYLQHRHEGMDLKEDEARDTLRNIFQIWTRPVHLETVEDGETKVLSYTGKDA